MKKIKPDFRMTSRKFLRLMSQRKERLPPGKHRRVFQFLPSQLGLEVDGDEYKLRRHHSVVVNTFVPPPGLKGKELKKAKQAHYTRIREEVLQELKAQLEGTILVPEAYDPSGPTTIDLSKLTTAGE